MNPHADDETARLRRAFAAMPRDAAPQGCPPAERLWDAVRGPAAGGEAGAGGVRELIEHVATCGACAEAWRLARDLEPAGDVLQRRPASPAWWRKPAWATAAAAAAMLVLALGLSWRQSTESSADAFRGSDPEQLRRVPGDGGRLSRRDPVLRWQPVEDATYDLRVTRDDLEPLLEVDGLESAEYRIPDGVLRGLAAGAELFWQVEVKTPDGSFDLPTYQLILE